MREVSPELFVDIPVKNEKSINLSMPLTSALPAAISDTSSLMKEISFELASINTAPNQNKTPTTLTTDKRRHVRNSSAGPLFDNPSGTILSPTEHMKKESSFEEFKKKEVKKMDAANTTSNDGVFKGGSLL